MVVTDSLPEYLALRHPGLLQEHSDSAALCVQTPGKIELVVPSNTAVDSLGHELIHLYNCQVKAAGGSWDGNDEHHAYAFGYLLNFAMGLLYEAKSKLGFVDHRFPEGAFRVTKNPF